MEIFNSVGVIYFKTYPEFQMFKNTTTLIRQGFSFLIHKISFLNVGFNESNIENTSCSIKKDNYNLGKIICNIAL